VNRWLVLADVANPTTSGELWFALYAAVAAVVMLALSALGFWLWQRAQTSKAARFGWEMWELAQAVVAHVEAKVRPGMRAALADGKLTLEERKAIQAEAMKALKEALGEQGLTKLKKMLTLVGGSAEVYLSGLLERAFRAFKAEAPPVITNVLKATSPAAPVVPPRP
jgi:hypothetical protein